MALSVALLLDVQMLWVVALRALAVLEVVPVRVMLSPMVVALLIELVSEARSLWVLVRVMFPPTRLRKLAVLAAVLMVVARSLPAASDRVAPMVVALLMALLPEA